MKFFKDLININIKKDMGIYNLTDEFFCLYLNEISLKENKNILVVVNSVYEANKLYSILSNYNENTYIFPMDDFLTSEALAVSPDLKLNRLETINKVLNSNNSIVITNLMGYLRFLPTKENYINSIINLKVGDTIEPSLLVKKINSLGYSRDTLVTKTGEFASRGFVVDIYPIEEDNPIRIEFFDDEIESIRKFNAEDQKSIKSIDSICIKPFTEFITSEEVDDLDKQKLLPIYEEVVNISSYLNGIVFFKDYDQLKLSYKNILEEIVEYKAEKDTDLSGNYMFSLNDIEEDCSIYYSSLNNLDSNNRESINFNVKSINNFNEDKDNINKFINDNINKNKTIIICLKKYQIRSILKNLNMKLVETDFDNIHIGKVNIIESELDGGFIYKDFILLTAKELFKNNEKKNRYQNKFKYATTIEDINKLSVGDYVVHNIHGIGVYNGIKTLTLNDITKDYLEVLYQGTDKIYIPVEKIDHL